MKAEAELDLLDLLVDRRRAAVDVGANTGEYTDRLLPLARHVYAYEPLPDLAAALRCRLAGDPRATVRPFALAGAAGRATIHVPAYAAPGEAEAVGVTGWASIVKDYSDLRERHPDAFVSVERIAVQTRTLDGEGLGGVGFVKIDVEGAESEVLRGAERTLVRELPVLLVEVEERHRRGAVAEVGSALAGFGYEGFFVRGREFLPMSRFDPASMQAGKVFPGVRDMSYEFYINNFVFLPPGDASRANAVASRLIEAR